MIERISWTSFDDWRHEICSEGHLFRWKVSRPTPTEDEPDKRVIDDFGLIPGGAYVSILELLAMGSMVQRNGTSIVLGKSITGRAVTELKRQPTGETLDTWSLIRAMKKSGYTSTAKDVYLSVYGVLNRAAKRKNSEIVKVGSQWGLRSILTDRD